jgi:uncharacterized glyoxalase superfamily protein PhnB
MKPNIFPMFQYADAANAIDWLVRALGFTTQRVQTTPNGAVARADLRFGAGAIGVRSAALATGPWAGIGQGIHVAVPGSDERTTNDLDGYLWSFGPDDLGAGTGEVTIVPELRYRSLTEATAWLHEHFGFETTFQVPGPDGVPIHVEMRLGHGTIYVTRMSTDDPDWADVKQFASIVVDDPDRHHLRAKAAGANIVIPPRDTPFGARFYAVRDPENVLWWLSTYRPAKPGARPSRSEG